MSRHSMIEFSIDSFIDQLSQLSFFFLRQFGSFELNDQISISSSIENFERHQINFTFANSIILSQWSDQHQNFSTFFFFVFFFVFFFFFFFFSVNDSFELIIKSTFFFQSKVLSVIKSASLHNEKSRRQTIKQSRAIWVKLHYIIELRKKIAID